jgi:hypothetical protein
MRFPDAIARQRRDSKTRDAYAVPTLQASDDRSYGGAFVCGWIERDTQAEAVAIAQQMIADHKWNVQALEEVTEISRDDYAEGDVGLQYYEQAEIDREVLVFHRYPQGDPEG